MVKQKAGIHLWKMKLIFMFSQCHFSTPNYRVQFQSKHNMWNKLNFGINFAWIKDATKEVHLDERCYKL